jgi:gas vesicle protein
LLIVAQSSDALAQMKAGAADQIAGVQDTVKAGANNLWEDAKTAISSQVSEWLNGLKESLMQSIRDKLDQVFH